MRTFTILSALICLTLFPRIAVAHCEIPCGIYDDSMRISMILEHADTIAKSMRQIDELSANPTQNANQLIRWVTNKESHATAVQEIVAQYFMTQRIKPDKSGAGGGTYTEMLASLHQMLIVTMKCKQTTDEAHTESLRSLVKEFATMYFSEEDRAHLATHGGQ